MKLMSIISEIKAKPNLSLNLENPIWLVINGNIKNIGIAYNYRLIDLGNYYIDFEDFSRNLEDERHIENEIVPLLRKDNVRVDSIYDKSKITPKNKSLNKVLDLVKKNQYRIK